MHGKKLIVFDYQDVYVFSGKKELKKIVLKVKDNWE